MAKKRSSKEEGLIRLPEKTYIGRVHLQVKNIAKATEFYTSILGFSIIPGKGPFTDLSANGVSPALIRLSERKDAVAKPPLTLGLYHFAIRYPDRASLGKAFLHLIQNKWPVQGVADHIVSEAIYLEDADGNGIELCADRPKDNWLWEKGELVMSTNPLDIDDLLQAVDRTDTWAGIHPSAEIGHIHLQVNHLEKAKKFYHHLIGLDVMQSNFPGAIFLSAGGYHHHIGINTWAGREAQPPPGNAVGLISYTICIPDQTHWENVLKRIQEAGIHWEPIHPQEFPKAALLHDTAENGLILQCVDAPKQESQI